MSDPRPFPVFDGHNDTLLRLTFREPAGEAAFFRRGGGGHIDLPRAREGGLAGGLFAVFAPTPGWRKEIRWRRVGPDGPVREAGWDVPLAGRLDRRRALRDVLAMMATLFRLERAAGGALTVVRSWEQLTGALRTGSLAAVLHLEGAEALGRDLDVLHVLHAAGLRSLGPVWSRPNLFGHGVSFGFPGSPDEGPGLTAAGRRLVRLCNELGILVDLSHMNARGFHDVARLSTAPLVASHSGAHALCPSPRNLTDDQLRAVAESGGIVGVNFARAFLRADGRGGVETSLTEIVRHVAYIAERIGVEHVGLGSDFDGTQVPQDLQDVAGLPRLVLALADHGFTEAELRKITLENWLRVLRTTWRA